MSVKKYCKFALAVFFVFSFFCLLSLSRPGLGTLGQVLKVGDGEVWAQEGDGLTGLGEEIGDGVGDATQDFYEGMQETARRAMAAEEAMGLAAGSVDDLQKQLFEGIDSTASQGNATLESHLTSNFTYMQISALTGVAGAQKNTVSSLSPEGQKAVSMYFGEGAIPSLGRGIALLYNQPASSKTYVADLLESAHVIPQAQAQGLGFGALDPVLETWKMFRNVAYLFFVFTFLIIGFMIMFRHKISGQTVVTAQQAIPQIIVSLLFVTFSYAIAGFLIDLMYLVMYFIMGLFDSDTMWINLNIVEIGLKMLDIGGDGAYETTNQLIQEIGDGMIMDVISWFGSLTVQLIVAIAILISIFKIFKELLTSYVYLICNVAFAPVFLMLGALPGQNVFQNWIKQIIGNLAPFPTVLLILLISDKITNYNLNLGGFMPPFMLGPGMGGVMPAIIGVGMMLVIPEIIKKVKDTVGVKGGVFEDLAKVAGERFSKGAKPVLGTYKAATGAGIGAAAGAYTGSKLQPSIGGKRGAMLGAAAGGIGARRLIKWGDKGSRAVSDLGERAENLQALFGINAPDLLYRGARHVLAQDGALRFVPQQVRTTVLRQLKHQSDESRKEGVAQEPARNEGEVGVAANQAGAETPPVETKKPETEASQQIKAGPPPA